MENRVKITKRIVDGLGEGRIAWDSDVRGFGVRRQREKKSYLLKARIGGRQRWITIGEHGSPWTPETARHEAQRLWGEIRCGVDIAGLRDRRRVRPAMAELCERYLADHARLHKKPSSLHMDERNIQNHVIPLLGRRAVEDVTRADIDEFKNAVTRGTHLVNDGRKRTGYRGGAVTAGGPGVANRCLALLSKIFNLAERWQIRPNGSNPVRHIAKHAENRKERYLSNAEFDRLAAVLRSAERSGTESPFVVAAIRLLILTGARLSEVLTLKWDHVRLDQAALWLPDSKTGRKTIYLSSQAIEIIKAIPRVAGNPYVIVGLKKDCCLKNLQKPWGRIRKTAGLSDVRIHDLRHSFASVAVASGMSLPIIGKLLGHTKSITTERYSHLAADPLRAANEKIGDTLGNFLRGDSR
jgi:site-specific recombinase XerD